MTPRTSWRMPRNKSWGLPPVGRDLCFGGKEVAHVRVTPGGVWWWYALGGWVTLNTLTAGPDFDTMSTAQAHALATWKEKHQ